MGQDPDGANLRSQIEALGWALTEVETPDAFADLLQTEQHAPVIVYSPRETDAAQRVLEHLALKHRGLPVVVVTDTADFGNYFVLADGGVTDYFEIREGPAVIAGALRRLGK